MNSHAKGLYNQRKSKKYILAHPEIYGSLTPERVFITKSSQFGGDMFSIDFIDRHNKPRKAGWDIITMPEHLPCTYPEKVLEDRRPIYIIQVKTNKFPEGMYLDTLKNFKVPVYVIKQLHVWENGKKEPIIIDL